MIKPMDDRALASKHNPLLLMMIFLKIIVVLASLTSLLNWLVPKTMNGSRAEFVAFLTVFICALINFFGLSYSVFLSTNSSSCLCTD